MELLKICPVCGYDQLYEPPYNEYDEPTYVICSCCGYEFGFDDSSRGISFEEYREKWIEEGSPFFNKKKKPSLWDFNTLEKQLSNIAKVNYKSRI